MCIGDSVLDEHYSTKVTKINPEFPTQCLCSTTDKPSNIVPGGAANLAYQATHFNCKVFLISLIDPYSKSIFDNKNINTDYSVIMKFGKVPLKRRFYDGDFPLKRWDIENPNYGEPKIENCRNQIKENILKIIDSINIAIISDYTKGLLSEDLCQFIISECNKRNIKTIVDPKCDNLNKWNNCTVFKPNAEFVKRICTGSVSNTVKWDDQAQIIKRRTNCESVIITDSGEGIYVSDSREFITYDVLSRNRPQIRSVIGAGDMFGLSMAMGISNGFDLKTSATIAYNMATVYIQDKHNEPVTPHKVIKWFDPVEAKKVTVEELVKIKGQSSKKWVFTNGVFDLLHFGHLESLRFAKNQGDVLVVAINSDRIVKKLKGESRPIVCQEHRLHMLASLEIVDFVILFDQDTPIEVIKSIKPNIIVKGPPYKPEDVVGNDVVEKTIIVPEIEGMSTTKLIEKIINPTNNSNNYL